jgi:energy-coupling factor transporter ATP-binding protein EcfA2
VKQGAATHYFDAESMNPHQMTGQARSAVNMLLRVRGQFSSHGKIMKAAMVSLPMRRGDVLLMDEPETDQDFAGIRRIHAGFGNLARRRVQVIAATHHPGLMGDATLIELETDYVTKMRQEMCLMLGCDGKKADEKL